MRSFVPMGSPITVVQMILNCTCPSPGWLHNISLNFCMPQWYFSLCKGLTPSAQSFKVWAIPQNINIQLGSSSLTPTKTAQNLGVILYKRMLMWGKYSKKISKCFDVQLCTNGSIQWNWVLPYTTQMLCRKACLPSEASEEDINCWGRPHSPVQV